MVVAATLLFYDGRFLLIGERGFAGLANLELLTVYFLFIKDFDAFTLADWAFSPTVRRDFLETLPSVGFGHILSLSQFQNSVSFEIGFAVSRASLSV